MIREGKVSADPGVTRINLGYLGHFTELSFSICDGHFRSAKGSFSRLIFVCWTSLYDGFVKRK